MNLSFHYESVSNPYRWRGLSQGSVFDTTSGTASFAVGEAGSLTAASLALVGLGPIGAIVGIGTQLVAMVIQQFKGCGQSCILTSQAADQVEGQLKQLRDAYFSSGRTKTEQAAALSYFDEMWQKLEQYCGSGSFGTAGTNCIQDRQSGACKWKASAPSWNGCSYVPAGPAGSGTTCWNWFIGYRDPIANDPCVQPDTPAVQQAAQQIQQATGINLTGLFSGSGSSSLVIALALVAMVMFL